MVLFDFPPDSFHLCSMSRSYIRGDRGFSRDPSFLLRRLRFFAATLTFTSTLLCTTFLFIIHRLPYLLYLGGEVGKSGLQDVRVVPFFRLLQDLDLRGNGVFDFREDRGLEEGER